MAARRISQETFDEVVRENVEEFDMDKAEAIKEAIAQFRKQGIDLSNIDLTGGEGRQQLLDAINTLQNTALHVADAGQLASLVTAIAEIGTVCDKSHMCSRRNLLIMEEEGGFNALQWHLDATEHNEVIAKVLKVLIDLSNQQDYTRDLFEPGGSIKIVSLLTTWFVENGPFSDEKLDLIVQCLVLSKVVSRSENNKNSLMKSNLGAVVVDLLLRETATFLPLPEPPTPTSSSSSSTSSITAQSVLPADIPVKQLSMWEKVCHVIRGLSTFDDFRAEMSCAGDNGKFFLKNMTLLHLLLVFGNSYTLYPELAGASLAAIRSFVNTNEAVQVIAQHGVLELLVRCLKETCATAAVSGGKKDKEDDIETPSSSSSLLPVSLVRAVASLVRNIAADDHRKEQLVGLGVIEYLHGLLVLDPYRNDAGIVEHVFGSFAQITLRAPGNAQRWMALGAAEVLSSVLRKFPEREALQRQACLSIRNIAGRCPELHAVLLDAGLETVLREAGRLNGCVDEAYSALRDLGCDVQYVKVGVDGKIVPAFEQFGAQSGKLNFRPVFEATDDLDQRIEEEGAAPFATERHDNTQDDHDHAHHHHHHHSAEDHGDDCGCR